MRETEWQHTRDASEPRNPRYDLRIRYIPDNYAEKFKADRTTLLYFYLQVRCDYMQYCASKVSDGMALQLGCLEIRRFCKDMSPNALEKKSNYELLEKDVGLDLFFPKQLQDGYKAKQFRKMIQQTFQQYSTLNEEQCIMKFFDTFSNFSNFDEEVYPCELAQGWSIAVDLVIGSKGIRQRSSKEAKPTCLAEFHQIKSITCSTLDEGKTMVHLDIAGARQPLSIKTSSLATAENMADLIDGYCRLQSGEVSSLIVRQNKVLDMEEPSFGTPSKYVSDEKMKRFSIEIVKAGLSSITRPSLKIKEADFTFEPTSKEDAQRLWEIEKAKLQATLKKQKQDMVEDNKWLENNEKQLPTDSGYAEFTSPPVKPPRVTVQPAPTAELDRTDDQVYHNVMELVKVVVQLKNEVKELPPSEYFSIVKTVGQTLRSLIHSVDEVLPALHASIRTEIEGTQKLLNKDMAELISKMKLAQQNADTSLSEECKRQMLAAAHTLAMDSKNLLDAVDQARVRAIVAMPVS
ncbi:UNVERIFIED_CONTAM: hypothetical protein FKN15_069789 [Acipenser sinensis]